MVKTKSECEDMLKKRVYNDYYMPLVKRIPGFTKFPISVQATMVSGAYNFGVSGMVNSRAAKLHVQGKHREGCEAQTAWNKAGGRVVRGAQFRFQLKLIQNARCGGNDASLRHHHDRGTAGGDAVRSV